jgi:predicted NBD/HSP70 family sugar kinase
MAGRQGTRGGDQAGLRAYNRRLILSVIRRQGPLPKAEIARITGLTPQSASVIVNELLREKLVRKQTKVRGRVGQPTTPIALDPAGALSLGVKIGRRSLEIALVDFLGEVIAAHETRYALPRVPEVMALLRQQIAQILGRVAAPLRARIVGAGVAVPWQLSGWGDVLGSGAEGLRAWDEVDLGAEIAAITGLPCEVWNDATAACAAEMMLGRAMDFSAGLYIYVGTFIGGGVVLEGRLFEGPQRNAGALGSMPVAAPGGLVQLIHAASLHRLDRALESAGFGAAEEVRVRVRRARGHPAWLVWRAEAARGIAQAIAAGAAVIDFEGAVIDAMLDPEDLRALVSEVQTAFAAIDRTGLSPLAIVPGTVGPAARSLGAAILPLVRSFAPDQELLVKRTSAVAA